MRRRVMLCAAVVAAVSTMVSSPTALAGTAPFARATQARASLVTAAPGWSSFQHDGQISGVDPAQASVTSVSAAWTSPTLDGKVVAQPLVVSGQVFVATESNSVYALNASTGAVIWHSNLGTAESYTLLPCGNIGPVVGISSTPVVDTVTGVIYVVALLAGPLLHHQLFALNTADGSTAWQRPIDAPGADPSVHNQEGALALSAGNVYVPFGGRFGECGNYTGRVVGSAEDGNGALITYTVPVTGHGAGIGSGSGTWAAGPSIDPGNGDLLVATGPAYNYTIADGGQSVLRLTPALSEVDRFTLSNWQALDATDIELSSGPVLVGGNRVFEMSQSETGYLLNSAALGGVGGEVYSGHPCPGGSGSGAVAVKGSVIYVPCNNGLVAVTVASDGNSFSTTWSGPTGNAGTPILTGGQVWSLYATTPITGDLYALDAATGAIDFHATVAATTPNGGLASGAGHVFVPVNSTIVAYSFTSAMAVLPAVSNGAYGGYVTAATIQNAGGDAANVHIAYFDQNGAPVGAGDANTSLPVNASWTVRQDNGHSFPSSGGDAAQAGSAIVYSDQPVAVFVNEFAPGNVGDATSYSGVQISGGVGVTLYAPTIVNNAYGGYTTGIGLLNEGGSPTDVTITYRDGSGAVVNTQTVSALAAHAYHALYSGDSTLALAGGFAGTATITSSAGQPLGAVVNETGPGGQFSSYDAVVSGSANLFAPVALNNAFGGYYTGMGIQNTTGSSGSVTINYYDASGTATTTTAPFAANGYLGVYQGNDIAASGAYTATITSTVAIAAIVNEVAPSNTSAMQSTSYNSFSAGDARLNLPLVENAGSDPWNTGEGIMNTGSGATTVTVNYFDTSTGAAVGTPQTQTLASHAFWGLYQPTGGLPSAQRATAVVTTSSGGQVAVICNESSTTTFMSYDGQ